MGVVRLDFAPPPYPAADKFPLSFGALMPNAMPRHGKQYLVTGFPGSKSKVRAARREFTTVVHSNACVSASAERYQKLKRSPDQHIVLDFNVRRVYGRKESKPFPTRVA
jgi:hypothetical protein